MSGSLVNFPGGQVSKVFGNQPVTDDLSAGIAASFAVMGYKGKVWSVKYRGDEKQLLRDDGDGARNSIEVVIVASSRNMSKIFYESGYAEGSNAAPDCFSNNGVTPDASAAKKQNPTCASCPRNVWGSKISEVTGKPGKQCQDNKRLAIVPMQDILNETYGGAMLLRVPAASLQEVAQFGDKMRQMGYPHYAFGTRIAFDTAESYPKFTFQAIRPLTDEEAKQVLIVRESALTARVLAEGGEVTPAGNGAAGAADVASVFEQPPSQEVKQEAKKESGAWTTASTQKPSSSTGAASSQPAQPAGSNGSQAATTTSSAPATASPHTTQTTEPQGGIAEPAKVEQKQAGATATTSNSPELSPSEFEKNLDAMISGLLPT